MTPRSTRLTPHSVAESEARTVPERFGVIGKLPRRNPLTAGRLRTTTPQLKFATTEPAAPLGLALARSFKWLMAGLWYSIRGMWASVRGNVSEREKGRRIREAFELAGGYAIKLGQELSLRRDLLSYEACDELSRLQFSPPPLAMQYVAAAVEEASGQPLNGAFASFDPKPIYSGLTACVYFAVLPSGKPVVVKVRRPRLRERLAAELRCMEWFTLFPQLLLIVRPPVFDYLRQGLRNSLREEVDFAREARRQRIFRRWAKRFRPPWLSAPRVYTQLSNSDVLVSDRVEGVRLEEMVSLVESGSANALEVLRAQGITPRTVARRLLQAELWGYFEGLFFHREPSDLVVMPGNKLIYLDFGSCASLSRSQRANYRELMQRLLEHDAAGMAEVALHILAPLPAVDVYELKKTIETEFNRFIFALRDKSSAWWERGLGSLWSGILDAARQFQAPARFEILCVARSAWLHQNAALRLDPDLRLSRAYRRYMRLAVRREARVYRRQAERVSPSEFVASRLTRAGQVQGAARRASWAVNALTADAQARLTSEIGKAAYAVRSLLQFGGQAVVMAVAAAAIGIAWRKFAHADPDLTFPIFLWRKVWTNPVFLLALAVNLMISIRRVLFRLEEQDLEIRD